jgi:hypothetical protein
MREAVDQLNRDRPQRDFILKNGVHRGASIAVTLNERLDYFGTGRSGEAPHRRVQ